MCGSTKPGETNLFLASKIFVFGPLVCDASIPTKAILPLAMEIWILSCISLLYTLTNEQLIRIRSAKLSPIATELTFEIIDEKLDFTCQIILGYY